MPFVFLPSIYLSMANTYFQFKQFTVHQELSAMKVCTDACLFGAWVSNDEMIKDTLSILDIGTGTGLLSLMLAQKCNSNTKITAIEIEAGAASEASKNFEGSPWANKIKVIHSSIQDYSQAKANELNIDLEKFDCIVTNPPFFEGDLHSTDTNKNVALHSAALPWTQLINEVTALLKPKGTYYVLIPSLRAYTMQKLAEQNGLQLTEEVVVYNAAKQKPFRVFQKFIKLNEPIKEIKRSNFIIKDANNNYTPAFTKLLAPYYLHL